MAAAAAAAATSIFGVLTCSASQYNNTNWNDKTQLEAESSQSSSSLHRGDIDNRPRLIFLGTGSSTGCPKPICTMTYHHRIMDRTNSRGEEVVVEEEEEEEEDGNKNNQIRSHPHPPIEESMCQVSIMASQGNDPITNKNYRNNPSLLVQHYDRQQQRYRNIVFDTGKTFRETALRWFPIYGVRSLDAIVLTHHHMDAAAGLDDVRNFQTVRYVVDNDKDKPKATSTTSTPETSNSRPVRQSIPLYLSDFCKLNLQAQFPWLLPSNNIRMPKQQHTNLTTNQHDVVVPRDVATFDDVVFQDYITQSIPFEDDDKRDSTDDDAFQFVPLPVWHGDDLISHGFAFTVHPNRDDQQQQSRRPLHVVYLSDLSRMVPETLEFIQTQLPPTDILIVDSLLWNKVHPVHYSLDQAVELAKKIQPTVHTYLVGMSCDSFLPHDEMNVWLHKKYNGTVSFAHDGLVVELPTTPTKPPVDYLEKKWKREPVDVFNNGTNNMTNN
jgi:phosphoribosyl 1,2-cyclic phosphodiesterase